jgi:hypothetical protein
VARYCCGKLKIPEIAGSIKNELENEQNEHEGNNKRTAFSMWSAPRGYLDN